MCLYAPAEVDGVFDWDQLGERCARRLRPVFILLALVYPLDGALGRPRNPLIAELDELARLRVEEGVADDQLLVVQVFLVPRRLVAEVLEIETQRAEAARLKPEISPRTRTCEKAPSTVDLTKPDTSVTENTGTLSPLLRVDGASLITRLYVSPTA